MSCKGLNQTKRMICPYCGESIRVNDMLFAGEECELIQDRVLAQFYLKITGMLPEQVNSRKLMCWRELPEDQVITDQDIVSSLICEDGLRLTDRVCCQCHNVIPDMLQDLSITSIIGNNTLLERFQKTLYEYEADFYTDKLLPEGNLEYWHCLGYWGTVIEKDEYNASRAKRFAALQQNCTNQIIMLQLESFDGANRVIDQEAVHNLMEILNNILHSNTIFKPVVFILFTGNSISIEKLTEAHASLLNYIENVCQNDFSVCFWPESNGEMIPALKEKMDKVFQK